MSFTLPFLLCPVFFRTALQCSGDYHMEMGGMPLHNVLGINCEKSATTDNQGSAVKNIFLKHQVNWNTVCGAMRDLPRRNIWSSDTPLQVLNEQLSLLVGRYVPIKIIRVRNKDKPWFDDLCRGAFDLKQEAHLRWTRDRSRVNWEEFVRCQVRANETYSETKHQFSVGNIDVLMNVQSPHKWWSTLKSTVFGSSLSLPPWSVRVGDWCVSRLEI